MSYFEKLVKSYSDKSLILRILVALILGAVVGYFARIGVADINLEAGETNTWSNIANFSKILGDFFVNALKAVAPVLVFILMGIRSFRVPRIFSHRKIPYFKMLNLIPCTFMMLILS